MFTDGHEDQAKIKETQWLKGQKIIAAYKCVVTQCLLPQNKDRHVYLRGLLSSLTVSI